MGGVRVWGQEALVLPGLGVWKFGSSTTQTSRILKTEPLDPKPYTQSYPKNRRKEQANALPATSHPARPRGAQRRIPLARGGGRRQSRTCVHLQALGFRLGSWRSSVAPPDPRHPHRADQCDRTARFLSGAGLWSVRKLSPQTGDQRERLVREYQGLFVEAAQAKYAFAILLFTSNL